MILALMNKNTGNFFQRNFYTNFEKHFFETVADPRYASFFNNIIEIEALFEAKLQHIPMNIDETKTMKIFKNLLTESKNFETHIFTDRHGISFKKYNLYNFYDGFKDIVHYQLINHNFDSKFANFFGRLKSENNMKKYIILIYGRSIEEISNLLGDDIVFDSKGQQANPTIQYPSMLLATNRKTDINLLKLCFENNDLKVLETKKILSLS